MNVLKAVNHVDDTPAAFSVNPGLQMAPMGVMQTRQGLAHQSPKRYLWPVPMPGFRRIFAILNRQMLSRSWILKGGLSMTKLSNQMQDLSSAFARDGYVTLPNVVSKPRLSALTEQLRGEYIRAREAGELFSGGGTISGHLNCFPGAQSRFVYDELEQYGVFDFVRKLSPSATRMPNVGCNLNLPNSSAQNPHADGNVATPFIIVNVAPVDTDIENGAMEVVPSTHLREYKYWQYALSGKPALRARMSAGDVV